MAGMKSDDRELDLRTELTRMPLLPVLVLDDVAQAERMVRCLLDQDVRVAEITLRTPRALDILTHLSRHYPALTVGAGTVRSISDVDRALVAGAQFAVSPGLDADMLAHARLRGMPLVPGVMTPGEVMQALSQGVSLMKFFPAEAAGGVAMLNALAGPFAEVSFIPTGGIQAKNAADYFALPQVLAVGCTWMADRVLMAEQRWEEIEHRVKEMVRLARGKGGGV